MGDRSLGRFAALALAAAAVGGCQTTGGLDTPDAKVAQGLIGSTCVVTSTRGAGDISRDQARNVHIHAIQHGQEFWRRYDASTQGVRSWIYHNTQTGQVYCGSTSWERSGRTFIPLPDPEKAT